MWHREQESIRRSRYLACALIAALWAGVSMALASESVIAPALVIIVQDGYEQAPAGCFNAIVLGTKFGTQTDSTGVARLFVPTGTYKLKLMRFTYVDTIMDVSCTAQKGDTLRVTVRRARGPHLTCEQLKELDWWCGGSQPGPDPEILKP